MAAAPLPWSKRLLFSAMLAALFFALFGLAEGILRLSVPQLKTSYFAAPDPVTGRGYTGGHPVQLNRFRMRERDFPIQKPPGERRVLCLGDSITGGYGIAEADAWPDVLERLIRQANPGETYFCINGAGTGATSHRQLETYRTLARQFGAEIVIVGFCMNDVRVKNVLYDQFGEGALGTASRFTKAMEWRQELRRSYVVAALDLLITEATKRYLMPLSGKSWLYAYPYQMNCFGVTPQSEDAWRDTLDSLRQLAQEVAADGATFVLAAFPYQFQISDDPRDNPYGADKHRFRIDPFEKLRRFAEEQGVVFVDLGRPFTEIRRRMLEGAEPWDPLFLDFCHPNERGQALAAETIFRELQDRGLLGRAAAEARDSGALPATRAARIAPAPFPASR